MEKQRQEWFTCPACRRPYREPQPGERRAEAYVYHVINAMTFYLDKQDADFREMLNPVWMLSPLVDGFLHHYPAIESCVREHQKDTRAAAPRQKLRRLLVNLRNKLCGKYDLPEAKLLGEK